ncbi:MAG: hypothetical protein ACLPSF_04095 [Methylocella sp.]
MKLRTMMSFRTMNWGMSWSAKALLFFSGVSAGLFGCGATVRAHDLPAGEASPRAKAMCAAYGPGFTAVEGSDTCVFVGGHVRVGFGSRGGDSPDTGWATGSAVRVNSASGAGAGLAPGHLRLPDGDSTGMIAR